MSGKKMLGTNGTPLGTSLDGDTPRTTPLSGRPEKGSPGGKASAAAGGPNAHKLRRGNTVLKMNAQGQPEKPPPAKPKSKFMQRMATRGSEPQVRRLSKPTNGAMNHNEEDLPSPVTSHPERALVTRVGNIIATHGVPVVQFRTVKLLDGKLQLQRRLVRIVKDTDSHTKIRVIRTPSEGTPSRRSQSVIQIINMRQVQRVLLGAETMTLKRAVRDIPNGTNSRQVDEDSCLSIIYSNEYMDFEVRPESAVNAEDFKLWLLYTATDQSMLEPPPSISDDSSTLLSRLRSSRAKDDLTTDAQHFKAAIEYCTLPSMRDQVHRYSTRTSSFDASIVGSLSCHGVEPANIEHVSSRSAAIDTISAKKNQDAGCFVCPLLGDDRHTIFVGVFDGHGEEGHHVSNYCMRRIVEILQRKPKEVLNDPGKAMHAAFMQSNDMLAQAHPRWGNLGGTTAVAVLIINEQCWIANCGDSRFTVATRSEGPGRPVVARDISNDHTPMVPSEKKRITKAGGFVAQDENEAEARVWIDREMTCGLAMSRSLGDLPFKAIGVTAEPEITKHLIQNDPFLVGASDGVWSVMSSQEAVDLAQATAAMGFSGDGVHALRASQEIIRESARRWKDEEGDYRDDITAIVVKLSSLISASPDADSPKQANNESPFRRQSAPVPKGGKNGRSSPTRPSGKGNRHSSTGGGASLRKVAV